ncbi:MAG: hypothetical protein NVSMB43_18310 [Pseudarthrobacter sp.]
MNVEEFTGIHFWLDGLTRYTVVHSRELAVLFVDTRPVDATPIACWAPTTRNPSSGRGKQVMEGPCAARKPNLPGQPPNG